MGKVVNIDDARPHTTNMIVCSGCQHKWIAVYPTGTDAIECPGCHNAVNEYGTRILVKRCKTCNTRFTVCPRPDNLDDWENCMAPECASYDKSRDVDDIFD